MSAVLEQLQYGFDPNSRRTWQRRSLTDTQDQHYGYDSLAQVSAAARGSLNVNLTAISGRTASSQSWDYDPPGNWRGYQAAANGTPTLDQHRVHDRGNRLTQIEDNPNNMILDRVGRMRQMAPDAGGNWNGKLEITWDAWSRITSVKNNGTVVGNYSYDGSHRRITREVDGDTLHSYFNDAWRPVEERKDAETTASISYLWGSRHRDDLVRRDRAVGGTTLNERRYVLMDYFNPAAITDETAAVKERYAFSAFGLRTILNPNFTVRSSSECGMEFAFQGQFLDGESGLMNYGYRYYSPQLGRWTCKDPIGEQGGFNLYTIVNNKALNAVDHLGLSDSLPARKPGDTKCCTQDERDKGEKQLKDNYSKIKAVADKNGVPTDGTGVGNYSCYNLNAPTFSDLTVDTPKCWTCVLEHRGKTTLILWTRDHWATVCQSYKEDGSVEKKITFDLWKDSNSKKSPEDGFYKGYTYPLEGSLAGFGADCSRKPPNYTPGVNPPTPGSWIPNLPNLQ